MSSLPAPPTTPKSMPVAALQPARRVQARGVRRAPRPSIAWLLVLPALAIASNTANPLPTMAAVASGAIVFGLLWQPGLPPALLFMCFMQWLQGSLLMFHADALGVEAWTLTYAHHIEAASYLTMLWVVLIAVGAFLVTRRIEPNEAASTRGVAMSFPRLLVAYGVWTLVMPLLAQFAPPQARQVIEALEGLRWALVYAVFAHGWSMQHGRLIVVGILCVEIAVGFLSYFSEFKTPLFLLAIALVSVGYRPTVRQYVALTVVSALTLYLAIVWSAIKMDYRERLGGGPGQTSQAIVLSTEEQIDTFTDLVGTIDAELFAKGAEQLVKRIAYVEYFAYVLDYVPSVRRHEEGRIWMNAVLHVFAPRVLFPDKAPLESDTIIAERYTGILFTAGRATSISIGLPAETYVDFGPVVMFVIPLLLGLLYGNVYRFFVTRKNTGAIGQGLAVAMHVNLVSVGSAAPKVLGGYVSVLIIALVLWRFGWPRLARFVRAQAR